MAKTMKFLDRMLTVFFDRHIPDSTSAKPRFMKNTRDAVIRTHTVSSPMVSSSAVFAWAFDANVTPARNINAEHSFCRLPRFMVSPRTYWLPPDEGVVET